MLTAFSYIVLGFVSTLFIVLTLAGLVNKANAREIMNRLYPEGEKK